MNAAILLTSLCLSTLTGKAVTDTYSFLGDEYEIAYAEEKPKNGRSAASTDGFNHVFGFDSPGIRVGQYGDSRVGYFYYDMDIFTTPFTENSMLVLIHTETSATSGYVAYRGGSSTFDSNYNLYFLKVEVQIPRIMDTSNGSHTGSVNRIIYWPMSGEDSPTGTATYTSSYGESTTLTSAFRGGINQDGVYLEYERETTISYTFTSEATISTIDPIYSSQRLPNDGLKFNGFSYFIEYAQYGRITYTMNTYSLYEIAYNVANFNRNGFVVRYGIDMEVVNYDDVDSTDESPLYVGFGYDYELRWNLGYNPSTVDYFA